MLKLKLQYFGHLMRRPWCWERLKAGGEGDDRGWEVWMASPTWWTWVWASSESRWWTGKPGVLQSMGSQRVGHHWTTEQQQQTLQLDLLISSLALSQYDFPLLILFPVLTFLFLFRVLEKLLFILQNPLLWNLLWCYPNSGSVQLLSRVQLFATPWTTARQASLSITDSWSLLKLMSTESINAIQPSHPPLSTSPPAFNLSQHQGLFIWVSFSHQVAKVLEFQLQHQSFQWIFRTDLL